MSIQPPLSLRHYPHTHIDIVRAHPDKGDSLGESTDYPRAAIVTAIKQGTTFVTIVKNTAGKWTKGQLVSLIKVNGIEYIKTADNGKAADNLGSLSEF